MNWKQQHTAVQQANRRPDRHCLRLRRAAASALRLGGHGGDKAQPPRSPKSTPSSPPPEAKESTPPSGIRGLPSGTSPPRAQAAAQVPRVVQSSPAQANRGVGGGVGEGEGGIRCPEGVGKEECVLPFLRKGAPRFMTLRFSITSICFWASYARCFCAKIGP
jgi:hypothetical protein